MAETSAATQSPREAKVPPTLTVRAFAEMLELPLYEQLRILEEQKYPTRAPQSFRVPYYHAAMAAIRRFFRSGGLTQVLDDAISDLRASGLPASRINNNIRVIQAFRQSRHGSRQLSLKASPRSRSTLAGVELRLTPDLVAVERQADKYILLNYRQAPLMLSVARSTLELVDWVLEHSGIHVNPSDLEFIDFAQRGRAFRIQRIRPQTLRRAQQNARAILQLWDGI